MSSRSLAFFVAFFLAAVAILSLVGPEWKRSRDAAAPDPPASENAPAKNRNAVVLIALDGFRGDYLNPKDTPRLFALLPRSAYSRELIPPFPSLTFPAHVTLATGRPVSGHGIPSNQFYEVSLGKELRFPGDSTLLRAEAIWTTASRQGVRALSYDWPLSHSQTGPHPAAYFELAFDGSLSDEDRIGRVLDLWEKDPERSPGEGPLRLVTSYAKAADSAGHREGPDAAETRDAVREVDALLSRTMERAKRIFDSNRSEGEELYFLFAADHGMDEITHFVNVERILGSELSGKVIAATSGNLANIYLSAPEAEDAAATLAAVDAAFAELKGARIFSPDTIPGHWSYFSEGRTGDRIVVLGRGHTFDRGGLLPVSPISPERKLRGMHGYPPDEVSEMAGVLFIHRYPTPLEKSGDLGPVQSTQMHATICEMLGISPAGEANPATIW